MGPVTVAAALGALKGGGLLYLVHVNADCDCIGSAFALQAAFGGTVGAPGGVSAPGRRLASRLGLVVEEAPDPRAHRQSVVLDCSTRVQLGPLAGQVPRPVLFDHHAYGDAWEEALAVVRDPGRSSTCEVVHELLRAASVTLTPEVAFALAVGIVSDTAGFRFANEATFRAMADLCAVGGFTLQDVHALLEETEEVDDFSRRMANLKAGQRAYLEDVRGYILAISQVSAHEASASKGLVRLGADCAFVAAEREGALRVSARGSQALAEAGVHLGHLVNAVATRLGASGGGHEGSAGMNGTVDAQVALAALHQALQEALTGKRRAR